MKQRLLLVVAIALALAIVGLTPATPAYADPPDAPSGQAAAANQIALDITINSAGNMSIGGIDLASLGVAPLDQTALAYAGSLQDLHLSVDGSAVAVEVQGSPALEIDWGPDSRSAVASLAARYGAALNANTMDRIEEWIANSTIDVTARYANEPSETLTLSISTPIWVDIAENGQVSVETLPLAFPVEPTTLAYMRAAASQATICWNQGTLSAVLDGAALPTVTLHPEGFNKLTTALGVPQTGYVELLASSKVGVDVALPGGSHPATSSCG
jgi:hypothetical protein